MAYKVDVVSGGEQRKLEAILNKRYEEGWRLVELYDRVGQMLVVLTDEEVTVTSNPLPGLDTLDKE